MLAVTSIRVIQNVKRTKKAVCNLQFLHMTPFSVLGWSEGARTAVHVAGQGKQMVRSMVLLAAGTRIDNRGAGIFRGLQNDWTHFKF